MDAVGYHPYLYDVTTMEQDTLALRAWLDSTGHAGVPIDINEFGAPTGVVDWGAQTAQYTQWALCTPALHVEDVQAYWWGAIPLANTDPWFAMVGGDLSETSFGSAYLSAVQALSTQGCPAPAPLPPTTSTPSPTIKHAPVHRKGKAARHKQHRRRHPHKKARRRTAHRHAVSRRGA
jgi:hypothetical protein